MHEKLIKYAQDATIKDAELTNNLKNKGANSPSVEYLKLFKMVPSISSTDDSSKSQIIIDTPIAIKHVISQPEDKFDPVQSNLNGNHIPENEPISLSSKNDGILPSSSEDYVI